MRSALVGYTGFVGGNLASSHSFDALYNSKNIETAYEQDHDLVVYAGVRAEKFLANRNPQGDRAMVRQAFENLRRMNPRKVVLISTIDVYKDPNGKDEDSEMETDGLQPYGKNRLELEDLVRGSFDSLIIRLPALFGKGLKKNFIFDAMTLTPSMLTEEKYSELSAVSAIVKEAYRKSLNGFYTLDASDPGQREELRAFFENNDWNAMSFTDSRSRYQFYDLSLLWNDICTAMEAGIGLLNITSEPVSASEVYRFCFGREFSNISDRQPASYDLRSKHDGLFGGSDGYCYSKEKELNALKRFVTGEER